jgi:hypothetical protein
VSTSINDGGPAFPLGEYVVINSVPTTALSNGMTLRDYFAAAALPVLLTSSPQPHAEHAAQWAYVQADAMLAERTKRKEAQP